MWQTGAGRVGATDDGREGRWGGGGGGGDGRGRGGREHSTHVNSEFSVKVSLTLVCISMDTYAPQNISMFLV